MRRMSRRLQRLWSNSLRWYDTPLKTRGVNVDNHGGWSIDIDECQSNNWGSNDDGPTDVPCGGAGFAGQDRDVFKPAERADGEFRENIQAIKDRGSGRGQHQRMVRLQVASPESKERKDGVTSRERAEASTKTRRFSSGLHWATETTPRSVQTPPMLS